MTTAVARARDALAAAADALDAAGCETPRLEVRSRVGGALKGVELAKAMGAKHITPFSGLGHYDATRYQSTHVQGGTIMGNSPDHAVVLRRMTSSRTMTSNASQLRAALPDPP